MASKSSHNAQNDPSAMIFHEIQRGMLKNLISKNFCYTTWSQQPKISKVPQFFAGQFFFNFLTDFDQSGCFLKVLNRQGCPEDVYDGNKQKREKFLTCEGFSAIFGLIWTIFCLHAHNFISLLPLRSKLTDMMLYSSVMGVKITKEMLFYLCSSQFSAYGNIEAAL